jgi:hypothetical protein
MHSKNLCLGWGLKKGIYPSMNQKIEEIQGPKHHYWTDSFFHETDIKMNYLMTTGMKTSDT